jgi:alpha-D-xyloside xylohydrolase
VKSLCLFLVGILLMGKDVFGQSFQSYKKMNDGIVVQLSEGQLILKPLANNAVRVQFVKETPINLPELIYLPNSIKMPSFTVQSREKQLELSVDKIKVVLNKQDGSLTFYNNQGMKLLKESPNSRFLNRTFTMGEPSYNACVTFDSPVDEALYGLGAFQDGHFNLRNVPRDLLQLNTQISIPFYYSTKGYGLLWHQYGETRFNVPKDTIDLSIAKSKDTASKFVEATTDAGTKKLKTSSTAYTGNVNINKAGKYAFFLNYGNMEHIHSLAIDGKKIIDQTNTWLPYSASAIVYLEKGNHAVEVIAKEKNSPTLTFQAVANFTTLESPNAKLLDYTVFAGPEADTIISAFRNLSGKVPMLPEHAFGFWQCKERYSSSTELINAVTEFRKRKIPLDIIVQDWQYWGKYGWGAMKFDENFYPNPKGMIDSLHQLNARFSISVWERVNKNADIGKAYQAANLYLPNEDVVDMLHPQVRKKHWENMDKGIFQKGVDGWWMDAVEPENDKMHGAKCYLGQGDYYRNTYPLFVSQAVYEGQRQTTSLKRVNNLTRCAFAGQQRYGTIVWSGDVGSTWDAFRRQINAGLGFCITGQPFFTTDIGGFFRPKTTQYTDTAYHELLIRWFQYGTFNAIQRIHGYKTNTELWLFGDTVLQNCKEMIDLRYRLIPYIYSTSWQVSKNNASMMKPLVMDFRSDTNVYNKNMQFKFGASFLVAPVVSPKTNTLPVYLPKSTHWFDFYSGKTYQGGQTIIADAPLNKIPLFVKAGSIVPIGKSMQYVGEKQHDTLEIRIYTGANGKFTLYEDEGDNYNYEQGKYATIGFKWNELLKKLTVGNREGSFEGMLQKRVLNIVLVNKTNGIGANFSKGGKLVSYTGKSVDINF